MVTSTQHAPTHKLTPAQISAFKTLARNIDRREGAAIVARGRAVFRRHGMIRQIVARLKARRLAQGLSLADISAKTGIAKPNLSRLENSERTSPTFETLHRYAHALGMSVRVDLSGDN